MIRRSFTAKGRADSGYYSIEGLRLHERAVRAGVAVEKVITAKTFIENPSRRIQDLFQELKSAHCQIIVVPEEIIQTLVAGRELGSILGLIKLPEQPRLAEIIANNEETEILVLAAVDVMDPGNVGALLRTAHAAGAAAFVTVGISDSFHPRALRTTRGSLFKIPVVHYDTIDGLLFDLREQGVEIAGTAVKEGTPLPEASFSAKGTAVLIGSEARGLSTATQAAVDLLVSIPMNEGVDSYSVNAAAAIVMYEINRQRF